MAGSILGFCSALLAALLSLWDHKVERLMVPAMPNPPACYIHAYLLWLSLFLLPFGRVLSLQSCLTLCDPVYCSPPGSSVHGILQAIMLEWMVMPFSRGSSQPRDRSCVSFVSCIAGKFFTNCATPGASSESFLNPTSTRFSCFPSECHPNVHDNIPIAI